MTLDEFKSFTSSTPITGKEKILSYMKSFLPSAYTSEPVSDRITGKIVADADNQKTDGEFVWYVSWIYHFEKYNIKLSDEFVQYVLTRPE